MGTDEILLLVKVTQSHFRAQVQMNGQIKGALVFTPDEYIAFLATLKIGSEHGAGTTVKAQIVEQEAAL